jgi:two-component system LytT family response regulator
MEEIRVIIVDDEPLAREGLRMRLESEKDLKVIGECSNGREAISAIERERPDLVFLDVQMPHLGGFDVVKALSPGRMPYVIFVTAYDEYALRAFEVHALDYLLKPVDSDRFKSAIERVRSQIRAASIETINERLRHLVADIGAEKKHLERVAIKSNGRVLLLATDEIDWIEAADNYVKLHAGRDSHLLHATMNSLESKLDPRLFLRIHRSTIVNISRIRELHPMFHGEYRVVLKNGAELTSGRSYKGRLQQLIENSF